MYKCEVSGTQIDFFLSLKLFLLEVPVNLMIVVKAVAQ